jgi:hypothetical protein
MDRVTQHNAAASEQMAAASREMSEQASQLLETASFFNVGQQTLNGRTALPSAVRPGGAAGETEPGAPTDGDDATRPDALLARRQRRWVLVSRPGNSAGPSPKHAWHRASSPSVMMLGVEHAARASQSLRQASRSRGPGALVQKGLADGRDLAATPAAARRIPGAGGPRRWNR